MIILQNVLQPDELREKALCLHENGAEILYNGYFNVFSLKKWLYYTELKNVALRLHARGRFRIGLYSERGRLFSYTEETDEEKQEFIFPFLKDRCLLNEKEPDEEEKPAVLWLGWTPLSPDAMLLNAAWITEDMPEQKVRLAVDVCTYRREECVRQLTEKILCNLSDNDSLEIFISDNGGTLCCSADTVSGSDVFLDRRVHLFSNLNVGGSGGFTRGLIEVMDRNRQAGAGFTHVIFADDDAVPEPDAFVRTRAMLSFVKKEYRGACVGGALLDNRSPWLQNEAGALYDHGTSVPLGKGVDLRRLDNVLKNEKIYKADYAGWWYACYPLETIEKIGLPLPLFIHFDDIEYGLRSGEEILYLNGICTWHGSFDERYAQDNTYYSLRNRFITNALREHASDYRKEAALCRNEIVFGLLRYQYTSAELVLAAVEDFCRGPEYLKLLDPEKKHAKIRNMADHFVPLKELGRSLEEIQRMEEYASAVRKGSHAGVHIGMKTYRRTLNGWLLPAKRSRKLCCYSVYRTDMRELYRQKEAALIDVYGCKGIKVKKSYRKALRCLYVLLKVSVLLKRDYKKAAEAYRKEEKLLESETFWRTEVLKTCM